MKVRKKPNQISKEINKAEEIVRRDNQDQGNRNGHRDKFGRSNGQDNDGMSKSRTALFTAL